MVYRIKYCNFAKQQWSPCTPHHPNWTQSSRKQLFGDFRRKSADPDPRQPVVSKGGNRLCSLKNILLRSTSTSPICPLQSSFPPSLSLTTKPQDYSLSSAFFRVTESYDLVMVWPELLMLHLSGLKPSLPSCGLRSVMWTISYAKLS